MSTIDHLGENGGKLKKVIGLPPKSNRLVPGTGPRVASEKCRVQIYTGFSGMSGWFSPLTVPLPFRDLPLRAPLVFFRLFRSSEFLARSASSFSAPLRLRSNALLVFACLCQYVTSALPAQVLFYLVPQHGLWPCAGSCAPGVGTHASKSVPPNPKLPLHPCT